MEAPEAEISGVADPVLDIGEFGLDAGRGVLIRGGEVVPLRPKTFAFLCHLARHRGRVVSKSELFDVVWPGLNVSEDSLTQCASELRKILGADGCLKTISKRGYLLDAAPAGADPHATLASQPAIAILPFHNMRGDPADAPLIDGLVDEVTWGLARFRSIVVIARHSAFSFPVEARPSLAEIGLRLGANFLVEGSMDRRGGQLRVSVMLSHAESGRQVWGGQFNFAEDDLVAKSQEIATAVISRLVDNIGQAFQRSSTSGRSPFAAFENLAQGIGLLRAYGPGVNERARTCFQKAVEHDPDFALAHAYLALADVIIADYGAAPRAILGAARDRANLAIALDPEEGRCHRIAGLVSLYLREHAVAENALRRAHDLNPYDADAMTQLGFVITMRGRPAEGLAWIEKAIALNPFRPFWYDQDRSYALYGLGRYDDAIRIFSQSPDSGPYRQVWLAAAYAMAGDLERAGEAYRRLVELEPAADVMHLAWQWSEFEHRRDFDQLAEGLAAARAAAFG